MHTSFLVSITPIQSSFNIAPDSITSLYYSQNVLTKIFLNVAQNLINIVFSNFVIVIDFLWVKRNAEFYIGLLFVAVLVT